MWRAFWRLAILMLCGIGLWQALPDAASAQQGARRTRSTRVAPAQRRTTTPQRTASRQPVRSSEQNRRATMQHTGRARGTPQSAGGASGTQQTSAQPMAFEKADAETRAAFLKLIGANWIWSPAHEKDDVPVGPCFFRKTFTLGPAEFGQIHIACDNQYDVYVNGRLAGRGADWRKMDVHDIATLLNAGTNVIAVKSINIDAGAAGLVARVIVKERGGTFQSFSTDDTWRTSVKEFANWTLPNVRDDAWLPARVYGPLGAVLPWGDEIVIAEEGSRFLINPEFVVERLVTDEQAGSLIAMAFNADGDILASREGGPLLLVRDANDDGLFEAVAPFCEQIKNVQGILSLGNNVFAVGEGPEGGGLYRIVDSDSDGRSNAIMKVLGFRGLIGEHGPHTVRLGPEGLLYVLVGNFGQVDREHHPNGPYANYYEGDLVQPRYEDPQGYAVGVPAPGGTILRTDMRGSYVELVAGGLRNPYDFAVNRDGELFTYDADMEWDIGAPWYRPTRVNHVPPGAEFGWRSGWAKWPEYYLDSLPATLDVGPGSPTGLVFYDHVMFPQRYRSALFIADWAMGQIHAVHLEKHGATYTAKKSTLLKGRPLNVTGLAVGPDGALYFCSGGRGTDGGVYRIRWNGTVPADALELGQGIERALRQPQFLSDWARVEIAAVKRNLGERWEAEILRVLGDRRAESNHRLRALDLLTFFGPAPSPPLLVSLAGDRDAAMRTKAVRLMGVRAYAAPGQPPFNPAYDEPLARLLGDRDAMVRRVACESIAHRGGASMPVNALVALLADDDRFVAFAARRALEKAPAERWQQQVLTSSSARVFLQGATGLLAASPSPPLAQQILARCEALLRGEVQEPGLQPGQLSDQNYLDTLRVIQLALHRGTIPPQQVPGLAKQISAEYPTSDAHANRELVKLLAYLQPADAAHKLATQIAADIADVEKLQIAAYAPRIKEGWTTADKLTMLRYFEQVRGIEGGHSVSAYIENFARDFFTNLTLAERRQVIAAGESFPTSTLSVLAKLPDELGPEILAEVRALDGRLDGLSGEPIARLRVGIVAVLGRSGEEESLAYLRDLYINHPERRAPIAMSLTQNPTGENWAVLVDSLRTIEGTPALEVIGALVKVARRPETSEPYRNAILLGLRMQAAGGESAVRLLEHWTGRRLAPPGTAVAEQLATWQAWYAGTFPNELPAELPKESQPNKWSFDEMASYLESPEGKQGSPSRGAQVFREAQCMNCHRFNGRGESLGPDLTAVSQRFQRKEILESIVYPSQVVSDQYASQIVIANGKTYTGVAVNNPDGSMTVLQSDGTKVELGEEDIEDTSPSNLSSMPEGLMNPLTLEQVADLFAFLMNQPEPNVAGRGTATAR